MPNTWKTPLRLLLSQLAGEPGKGLRIAILGVGNVLRSDDAAGILTARALSRRECAADRDHVLILEAGLAPENSTADIRRFAPDLVLLIDAADMGKEPGAVAWISAEEIDGMSASTHSLPLSMLTKYLILELGCQVRILGIQAALNEVGETVSAEVLHAVEAVVAGLDEIIRDHTA